MTTTELNNILARLNEKQTREDVLDLAFALLEWMNVEPIAANKPQLLSPQTQKLKEYLAPAPQTVQPQLYRLSADNQNIRVRFAVLKKLKKDYISQLVDNDPGLGSYQSLVKGLNSQNGTGFVPNQPYFIHFVTTPDYNKLVLIFNQGDNKRIVTFRNRLTNTQYNKIILAWQGIGKKGKPEIADLLWKSLDIKEVNKEFYRQVKERFDALLGILKQQNAKATENQAKQFTVRLIGRYIFCWFLKEKGIVPHTLIGKATIAATKNYYQDVLLKLFFETLNTKVQDRSPLALNKQFEKIPYLNGGLFDESDEDKLFEKLKLDAWLLPFVEILESYDFTVDESSSQYQQVAVDPEMLGRIFENLLASQNEETEKLANQRKALGAFYTPREIVDYMVNESIRAYLQTQWEIAASSRKSIESKLTTKQKIEKALEPLFSASPDATHLKKDEKNILLESLEGVKIFDPACGSGAFPMGILHKLVELHELLGTVRSSYELKKNILSLNIYGVDIMPMAIEIARLRAWLSLVLEEEYKPNDFKHNFGVKPLPNLDFKFVCANTLIDSGYDEFLKKLALSNGVPTLMRLDSEIQKLETIRDRYFDTSGNQQNRTNLRDEFIRIKEYIKTEFTSIKKNWALDDFFDRLDDWNPFDDSHASSFFSPSWMFGSKFRDGFDIVIGNPPYSSKQSIRMKEVAKNYKYIEYKCDPYAIFIEYATRITSQNGIVTFITPLTWFTNHYYFKLRKFLIDFNLIKQAIMFDNQVFDSANVDTAILILSRSNQSNSFSWLKTTSSSIDKNAFIPRSFDEIKAESRYEINISEEGEFKSIRNKMESKSQKLSLLRKISLGMKLKENDKFVRREKNRDYPDPIIFGSEIGYYEKITPTHFFDYKSAEIIGGTKKQEVHHHSPKIMIQAIRNLSLERRIVATIDTTGYYFIGTVNALTPTSEGKKINDYFLLALINSNLLNYYFKNRFTTISLTAAFLGELPIARVSIQMQNSIEKITRAILAGKIKNQNTSSLEKEIDILVYKIYNLTYDEVKIIDKDFWLSEEEYSKLKY